MNKVLKIVLVCVSCAVILFLSILPAFADDVAFDSSSQTVPMFDTLIFEISTGDDVLVVNASSFLAKLANGGRETSETIIANGYQVILHTDSIRLGAVNLVFDFDIHVFTNDGETNIVPIWEVGVFLAREAGLWLSGHNRVVMGIDSDSKYYVDERLHSNINTYRSYRDTVGSSVRKLVWRNQSWSYSRINTAPYVSWELSLPHNVSSIGDSDSSLVDSDLDTMVNVLHSNIGQVHYWTSEGYAVSVSFCTGHMELPCVSISEYQTGTYSWMMGWDSGVAVYPSDVAPAFVSAVASAVQNIISIEFVPGVSMGICFALVACIIVGMYFLTLLFNHG